MAWSVALVCLAIIVGLAHAQRVAITPSGTITLSQSLNMQLTVTLDDAIVCPQSQTEECSVIVKIEPTANDLKLININPCYIKWTTGQHRQLRFFTLTAQAGLSSVSPFVEVKLQPTVVTRSEYYSNFKPAEIVIKPAAVAFRAPGSCNSVGDPHTTTIDNNYWHFYDGDSAPPMRYTQIKATRVNRPYGPLVVQTQVRGRPALHCALAGREGNNMIIIDVCGGVLRITSRFGDTDPTLQPTLSVSGSSYTIEFKSGAWARAECHVGSSYMNMYLSVPGSDSDYPDPVTGKSRGDFCGICGNFNGIPGDDFPGGGFKNTIVQSYSQMFDCQRIMADYDNFNWYPSAPTPAPPAQPGIVCAIPLPVIIPQVVAPLDSEDITALLKQYSDQNQNVDRFQFNETDAGNVFPPYDPDLALADCHAVIDNDPVYLACARTYPSVIPPLMPQYYVNCVMDVVAFGGEKSFIADTLGDIQGKCRDLAAGSPTVPPELQNILCPKSCSNRGVCVNLRCDCDYPFVGADCSVDATKPPVLTSLSDVSCDLSGLGKTCPTSVLVGGFNFYFSVNMTCQWTLNGVRTKTSALYLGSTVVACPLPVESQSSPAVQDVYQLKVANNNVIFSGALNFTFYNGICQVCSGSRGVVACAPNPTSCTIAGVCYQSGIISTVNPCLVCDAAQSSSAWSYSYTNRFSCGLTFDQAVYSSNVFGKSDKGTPILQVRASNPNVATDPNFKVKYSIGTDANGTSLARDWYVIDETTGWLYVNRTIDLADFMGMVYMTQNPTLYSGAFIVEATDQLGSRVQSNIIIAILAANAKPAFDFQLYNGTLAENVTVGTNVTRVTAHDPRGADKDYLLRYSIYLEEQGYEGLFQVNALTGQVSTANVLPPYAEKNLYHVQVRATDSSNLWYLTDIKIKVTMVPYAPTNIIISNTRIPANTVNVAVGTLLTVGRNDPKGKGSYTYTVTSGPSGQFFVAINTTTNLPTLYSSASIDFVLGGPNTIVVGLRATDAVYQLSVTVSLTITLFEIHTPPYNPTITLQLPAPGRVQVGTALTLREDESVLSQLGTATAMSKYSLITNFNCQLSLTGAGTFTMSSNQLIVAKPLSFAVNPTLTLEMMCGDDFFPVALFTPYIQYTVTVLEVPKPPQDLTLVAPVIVENVVYATPTKVGVLTAYDYDTLPAIGSRTVSFQTPTRGATWTFSTANAVCVANPRTTAPTLGVMCTADLLLTGYLNFERDVLNLGATPVAVTMTDEGGRSATATVTVSVSNVNDAATAISLNVNSIQDVVKEGDLVAIISAVDEDIGQGHQFLLLSSDANAFRLETVTARRDLTVARLLVNDPTAFHTETNPTLAFTVSVTDLATTPAIAGPLFTRTFSQTINVVDTPMTLSLATTSFPENTPLGVLETVSLLAFDKAGLTVAFSLADPSGTFVFLENPTTFTSTNAATLTLAKTLNFEARTTYPVTITATFAIASGPVPAPVVLATTFTVLDVDEAPLVTIVDELLMVPFNSVVGYSVATFPTPDENGRDVAYSLSSPSTNLAVVNGELVLLTQALNNRASTQTITVVASVATSTLTTEFTLTVAFLDACGGVNPCQQGGACTICTNLRACIVAYTCTCPLGLSGPNCDLGSPISQQGSKSDTNDNNDSSAGLSSGALAGIAVGAVLLLILIIMVGLLYQRYRSRIQFDDSEGGKWADAQAINPTFQAPNKGMAAGYSDLPGGGFEPGVSNPMYDWYHPDMGRQECAEHLDGLGEGAFVIRDSAATPGWHMMGVKTGNEVVHEKIRMNDDGQYELLPCKATKRQPLFKDLPSLVDFYLQPHEDFPYILAVSNPIYDNHQLQQAKTGEARPGYIMTDPMAPNLPLKNREVANVEQLAEAVEDEEMYTNSMDAKKALNSRAHGSMKARSAGGDKNLAADRDVGYLAIQPADA